MKTIINSTLALLICLSILNNSFAQSNFYWVGGTGNWSDFENHWARSSGGDSFHNQIPTEEDTVIFDANSFYEESQKVTIDTGAYMIDFNSSEALYNPTIYMNSEIEEEADFEIFGSAILGKINYDMEWFTFSPQTENAYFDPNGNGLPASNLYFNLHQGSMSILDSLHGKDISVYNVFGNFNSNGNPIHATEYFGFRSSIYGTFDVSNSRIYTKNFRATSALGADGKIITTGASVRIIYPDGYSQIDKTRFPSPIVQDFILEADHSFQNTSPKLDKLTVKKGVTLYVHHYIEGLEINELIAEGYGTDRISIKTLVPGNVATIIQKNGTVDVVMVDIEDVDATGGAVFTAHGSTGTGSFAGWNFVKSDQNINMALPNHDFEDINQVFTIDNPTSSGLDLNLTSSDESVAIISGTNEYTIVGMGTTQITANQLGNDIFNPAAEIIRILDVSKAEQTISFGELEDQEISTQFYNLNASSSSSLSVTYNIIGPGILNGNTIEFTGSGLVEVIASQAGNNNYAAANEVVQQFNITKVDQTIDFRSLDIEYSMLTESLSLVATASSSLEVELLVSGPAILDNNVLTFTGAGTVSVTAKQDGNDYYSSAQQIEQSFSVFKEDQVITFNQISDMPYVEGTFQLNASTSSGLDVMYQVTGPATINDNMLSLTSTGLIEITATQIGNNVYNTAESITQTFEVLKIEQELTFPELTDVTLETGSISLEASSTTEIAIVYTVSGPATLDGNTLMLIDVGVVEVIAMQEGNDIYHSSSVNRTFEVLANPELALNVENNLNEIQVTVYPNPTKNTLNIQSNGQITQLSIFNQLGQLVETYKGQHPRLDIQHLPSGIYFLNIANDTNSIVSVKRFVKL